MNTNLQNLSFGLGLFSLGIALGAIAGIKMYPAPTNNTVATIASLGVLICLIINLVLLVIQVKRMKRKSKK